MADLQRGVVKWFNDAKGFGFIEHTTGRDVFVHYSVIEWEGFKTLKDGEEVEYELCEGDKGLHAAKVLRRIPKPAPGAKPAQSEGESAGSNEAGSIEAGSITDQLEIEHISAGSNGSAETNGVDGIPAMSAGEMSHATKSAE